MPAGFPLPVFQNESTIRADTGLDVISFRATEYGEGIAIRIEVLQSLHDLLWRWILYPAAVFGFQIHNQSVFNFALMGVGSGFRRLPAVLGTAMSVVWCAEYMESVFDSQVFSKGQPGEEIT